MKSIKLILAVTAVALTAALAGCGKSDGGSTDNPSSKTIPGILINGVHWAECNVDAPGTFAASAESYGMLYMWNSKAKVLADTYPGGGNVWTAANDPCPAGWRVPTKDEQATLLNTDNVTYVWAALNSVSGGRFTDIVSGASIFLPAAGYCINDASDVSSAGHEGAYWSSSPSSTGSWSMGVYSSGAGQDSDPCSVGESVRCVSR